MNDSASVEQGTNSEDNPSTFNTEQTSAPLNMLPGIKPPGILDIRTNTANNWKTYKQIWQNYAIITNLNAQPDAYKVYFYTVLGLMPSKSTMVSSLCKRGRQPVFDEDLRDVLLAYNR